MFFTEALLAECRVNLVPVFRSGKCVQQGVHSRVQWKDEDNEPRVSIARHFKISEGQKFEDYYRSPAH